METATQINPIEIINSVSSFYEAAWNHLLWFVVVAGAIIGVLVPYLIQLYQRRLFKVEEGNIKQELDKHVNQIKADLLKSIEDRFGGQAVTMDNKFSELHEELAKEIAGAKGGVYFVQARVNREKKSYGLAVRSYALAAIEFLHADSHENLQKVLGQIEECLSHVVKKQILSLEINDCFGPFLKGLEAENTSGRYAINIRKLKREWQAANERETLGAKGE
ncbi:MAG: hypothetical protein Tsb0026_16830 [Sulfuricaulis sp.]